MTRLRTLSDDAFPAFGDTVVASYADDNVASGRWLARDALEASRAEIASLLPDGPNTRDHHLFEIEVGLTRQRVGFVWFATFRRAGHTIAFLYQLIVLPEHRPIGRQHRFRQGPRSRRSWIAAARFDLP